MDSAYVRSTPETPWRTAAIVAAAVAAVELFILVILGVIVGAKVVNDHADAAVTPLTKAAVQTSGTTAAAITEAKTATSSGVAATALPRRRTSVIVLNGNGIPGAAAVTADRLRHFHYIVAATGNAPRSFSRSVIMYRPRFKEAALRLGHDLHVRRVVPLDGITARDLQGAHIAVVIGG